MYINFYFESSLVEKCFSFDLKKNLIKYRFKFFKSKDTQYLLWLSKDYYKIESIEIIN